MTIPELLKKANSLPLQPGCYIMKDAHGEIIYIGKAKKLKNRVTSYFREDSDRQPKVEKMVSHVNDFDYIVTDSEFEALVLECSLIKQNMPKYNILMKDDKGFCYVKVSLEEYPRITAELQMADDGATYYGPYISPFAVKSMVETAVTAFRLPTCTRRFPNDFGKGRPCLNAHIGRCMALCSGKISREEYLNTVNNAVELITKDKKTLIARLKSDMNTAAENLEFERAARLRDSIDAIEKTINGQKVVRSTRDKNMDVFAFAADERNICAEVLKFRDGLLCDKDEQLIPDTDNIPEAREEFMTTYYLGGREIPRKVCVDEEFESLDLMTRYLSELSGHNIQIHVPERGENRALVSMAYSNAADRLKRSAGRRSREEASMGELANMLGLPAAPKRIEAYDISNYGSEAVAGMVVFDDGSPKRSAYRRFIIKTVDGVDDYASMTEVIMRRVNRYNMGTPGFNKKPDVILLDGGRGHLATIWRALEGTSFEDVPVFGMVKDNKHRTRGVVAVEGEIDVKMHKLAFSAVSRIQEEVHRYTVDYQRSHHTKNALKSFLQDIPGVGEKREAALLKAFKNIEGIKAATLEQLCDVKGMNESCAGKVYDFFHGEN